VFGIKLGLLGDLDGHDELVMRGSFEAGNLVGWYLRDGRLVAGLIVGQTADFQIELTEVLRVQARLTDRAGLTDPEATPLSLFARGG